MVLNNRTRNIEQVTGMPRIDIEFLMEAAFVTQDWVEKELNRAVCPSPVLRSDHMLVSNRHEYILQIFEWMGRLPELIKSAPISVNQMLSKHMVGMYKRGRNAGQLLLVTGTLPYESEIYAQRLPFSRKLQSENLCQYIDDTLRKDNVANIIAVQSGVGDLRIGDRVWVKDYMPPPIKKCSPDEKAKYFNFYETDAKNHFRFIFLGDSHDKYGDDDAAVAAYYDLNPLLEGNKPPGTSLEFVEYDRVARLNVYESLEGDNAAVPCWEILTSRDLFIPLTQIVEQELLNQQAGIIGIEEPRFSKILDLANRCHDEPYGKALCRNLERRY